MDRLANAFLEVGEWGDDVGGIGWAVLADSGDGDETGTGARGGGGKRAAACCCCCCCWDDSMVRFHDEKRSSELDWGRTGDGRPCMAGVAFRKSPNQPLALPAAVEVTIRLHGNWVNLRKSCNSFPDISLLLTWSKL